MRPRSSPCRRPTGLALVALVCAACLLVVFDGAAAQAQAQAQAPLQPGAPAANPWLQLFGIRPEPPAAAAEPQRRAPRPQRPVGAPREAAAPAPEAVEITRRIAVFGDSLAHNLGSGLADVLADKPHVAVTTRSRGSSGLVRDDFHDWRAEIEPILSADPPFDIGVVLVGLNDRQEIATPEGRLPPLGDAWKEAYAARVDTILARFSADGKPLVWVGLPPTSARRLTTDLQAINEVIRARVHASNGIFVDIWQGFVDDDDRYAANGPTLEGRIARLRASDGIHFTPAGSRKAAHFVEIELRRLLAVETPPPVEMVRESLPPSEEAIAEIDEIMAHLVSPLLVPEAEAQPVVPRAAPAIGPVFPLTGSASAGGAQLLAERPRVDRAARLATERVLADGLAPTPVPGRADDFSWPPRADTAASAAPGAE